MILQDAEDHEERDKDAFHSEAPINVALVLRLYIERSKRIHCTPIETLNRTIENRPLLGYVEDLSFNQREKFGTSLLRDYTLGRDESTVLCN